MSIFEKIWPKEKENSERNKKDDELIIDPNTGLVETKKLKDLEDEFDKKRGIGPEEKK